MLFQESSRIDAILDDYVMLSEEAAGTRPARSFHASGITECQRKQIYDRLGYPKHETQSRAKWIRSRDVGNLIHTYYSELFKGAEVLLANEESVPANEFDIGGRLDDLLYIEERHIIVDIKTVGEDKFKKVPKGEKFEENYAQIQLYLHFLDLDEGILFYVNRSDNETKEFTVYRDPEMIDRLLNRAAQLKFWYANRIIPRPQKSYKCRFCPFQTVCVEDGDGEFQLAS